MARRFIIEEQGRYYVCEAAIEYDPAKVTTEEERKALQEVAAMLNQARKAGRLLAACSFETGTVKFSPLNTDPPPED